MGLSSLLIMCGLLGGGSFAVGSIPLSFALSKTHLSRLSALGTGLLLGAALGIIIPEGIETLADSHSGSPPVSQIALCLLSGFTFMLILEQLAHAHSASSAHSADKHHALPMHSRAQNDMDAEIDAMERELEADQAARQSDDSGATGARRHSMTFVPGDDYDGAASRSRKGSFPVTLGLVVHALADGLALGSSALTGEGGHPAHGQQGGHGEGGGIGEGLSVVVFLALLVHKAPTALALTTSLLAGSLPRAECKKHLLVFSLATPLGAMLTYAVFSILGAHGGLDGLAGGALLVSGGTFLYVATVLQPVSGKPRDDDGGAEEEDGPKTRVVIIVVGIFLPYLIGSVLGHGH